MSTTIHATVDALGNPTGFFLTGGQASDLAGADALLPQLAAGALIADRGYDAEARVLAPLREVGTAAVIPPKRNRKVQRAYDQALHLLALAWPPSSAGACSGGAGRRPTRRRPAASTASTSSRSASWSPWSSPPASWPTAWASAARAGGNTPRHGLGDTGVYLMMAGIALGNWRGYTMLAAQEPC